VASFDDTALKTGDNLNIVVKVVTLTTVTVKAN